MERFLKPVVKRAKLKRHSTFDIETNRWKTRLPKPGDGIGTRFEMAGYFDGRTYTEVSSIRKLMKLILQKRNRSRVIYAHNGGRFDFLFLFDEIERRGLTAHLITQGPRVTAIKIEVGKPSKRWRKGKWVKSGAHYITLQDSAALMPAKLSDLCDTFKPAHAKMTGTIDFERERVDKNNPLHRQYLEADCRSLWEIVESYKKLPFIKDVGPRMTIASTSMAAWRSTMPRPIRTTSDKVQAFVRKSYAGGRCEIFRQVMGEGVCVDANSLYPAMMLKPLPTEYICEAKDVTDFGFHDVTVSVPDCYMPILWTKTPKLIFPTGVFRGTYFSEELKLALEQGARIVKYHGGKRFEARDDLFRDFINVNFQLRKDNPGTSLDYIGKMLMTNCYGKFAEREIKQTLMRIDPRDPASWPKKWRAFHSKEMMDARGYITVERSHRSPHMLCHLSSAVTAWGRVHMARNIYIPRQADINYTDTDSGFIRDFSGTGKGLGEFKREYGVKAGFFLLPKGYYLHLAEPLVDKKSGRETWEIKKLKGFSKKAMEAISYELFQSGNIRVKEKKLAGFRSALIRENRYLALINQKKSVISEYNKRKIMPGGETRPWHLNEGVLK